MGGSFVDGRKLGQVVFLAGIFILIPVLIVAPLARSWADWVIYGVIVVGTFGAFRAIRERQYPTQKRTFVREYDDRQR
jgi:hypothetical protein